MKILLINPSQSEVYGKAMPPDYPPLGLGYLGAVLEKDHEVKILDVDAEGIGMQSIRQLLLDFNPSMIGITCTTPTYQYALQLASLAKSTISTEVVLGGMHPTLEPTIIEEPVIDYIIIGEGEITITELANHIEVGSDLSKIDGIAYQEHSKTIFNKPRKQINNLDELPFPARHLFTSRKYTYPDALFKKSFPIFTSRGCPGQCTYCCSRKMFHRFTFRSAKNIADEIDYLIRDYDAKEIHIWDDCFTLIKERVFELRDELKRRNIRIKIAFPNGLRVDMVDYEILKALKDMGTYSVAFGVESGNQEVLDSIKKGTNLKQIRESFRVAKELGIETWGFFMLGLPRDTKESMTETIDFAIQLNPYVAKFHIMKPYPGTEAYNYLSSQDLILDYDYLNYGIHTKPVHRLPKVSPNDLIDFQKRAYRKFYLRPSKIIDQIKRIKSWNRLKLNAKAGLSVLKMMF